MELFIHIWERDGKKESSQDVLDNVYDSHQYFKDEIKYHDRWQHNAKYMHTLIIDEGDNTVKKVDIIEAVNEQEEIDRENEEEERRYGNEVRDVYYAGVL